MEGVEIVFLGKGEGPFLGGLRCGREELAKRGGKGCGIVGVVFV
jgi:hypothetical protein